jgi:NifU-like protein involved in Fe-S cluster formation
MRRDVYHYFQQACRRKLRPELTPLHFVEDDGASAGFTVWLGPLGRIDDIEYRCTTCMTLVALCEHTADELRGDTLDRARAFTAGDILRSHPEIPPGRHSRAHLAAAALHAALDNLPI